MDPGACRPGAEAFVLFLFFLFMLVEFDLFFFFDASTHLYERVRPSVRPSVCP